MQCERCGSENFGVINTLRNVTGDSKFNLKSDMREYVCKDCDQHLIVECRAHSIKVYDPDLCKTVRVSLPEYRAKWAHRDNLPPQQPSLFGGE